MQAASLFDGFPFDDLPLFEYGRCSAEVDVSRRQVVQALVISAIVVVLETCMSSEHFGRLAWQFKRVSGSSGLKVQAAIVC